jgi:hypothetical protein
MLRNFGAGLGNSTCCRTEQFSNRLLADFVAYIGLVII